MGSLNPFVIGEIRELRLVNSAGQDVWYSIIGDVPGKPPRKWILQQYRTRIPAIPSFHSEHVLLAKDTSRLVYFHAETITPSDVWISYESGPERSISISSTGQVANAVAQHHRSQLGEISIPEPSSLQDATAEVHSAGSGRNIWVAIVVGFVGLVIFILASCLYLRELAASKRG